MVVARRTEAAAELSTWLNSHFGVGAASPGRWGAARGLGSGTLVVHATSLGHGGSDGGDALVAQVALLLLGKVQERNGGRTSNLYRTMGQFVSEANIKEGNW